MGYEADGVGWEEGKKEKGVWPERPGESKTGQKGEGSVVGLVMKDRG